MARMARRGCFWLARCARQRCSRRLRCPPSPCTPRPAAGRPISLTIQTLLFLTSLTFLPALLLMMTSFTRIVIVLSLLRQALGTVQAPPNQVLVGLSLFLTFFVMAPVFERMYSEAYVPFSERRIGFNEALERGVRPAQGLHAAADPRVRSRAVRQARQGAAAGRAPTRCR